MNKNDFEKFSKMIMGVGSFFDKAINDAALDMWFSMFREFPLEVFASAIEEASKRAKFMPRPGDVLEEIKKANPQADDSRDAQIAWSFVVEAIRKLGRYDSPKFSDPAIHTAIRRLGGWEYCCNILEKNFPFEEKRFIEIYQGAVNEAYHPEEIIGLFGKEPQGVIETGTNLKNARKGLADEPRQKIRALWGR